MLFVPLLSLILAKAAHLKHCQSDEKQQDGENESQSHTIEDMCFLEPLFVKTLHIKRSLELLSPAFGAKLCDLILEAVEPAQAVKHICAHVLINREVDWLYAEYRLTCAALLTGSETN